MICQKNVKHKQEKLLPLLAFTAFLFVLAFALGAGPVYAPPPIKPDRPIDPGGDPPPSTIDGYILDPTTGGHVSGMPVYLYVSRFIEMQTLTDSGGYFVFHHDGIYQWSNYELTVNGWDYELGNYLSVSAYNQMRVTAHTDDIGYARLLLHLDRVKEVKVPAAVFYSNTPYTERLAYSETSSHDLSFHNLLGGNGFESAHTWSRGITWFIQHTHRAQYARRYYLAAVYDNRTSGNPTIASAGVTDPVDPLEYFHTYDVEEYLTPNLSEPNYGLPPENTPISFVISEDEGTEGYYTEASSVTWSYGMSGSVGIHSVVFGISLNVDITASVSSGHTNAISFTVGPLPPGTLHHKIVVYTRGFDFTRYDSLHDPNNKGGLEFHIWDMGEVP